jgi:hypothetical protein
VALACERVAALVSEGPAQVAQLEAAARVDAGAQELVKALREALAA